MKTKEEKLHSLVLSVTCLAYRLEDLNDLHLANSICIVLDELAQVTDDEYDRESLKYLSDRIFKSLKKQGLYDDIRIK